MKKYSLLLFTLLALILACGDDDDDPIVIPSIPSVSVSNTSVSFGNVEPGTESNVESISITGSNLTANITVSVPNGFLASLEEGGTFGTTDLTISQTAGSASATVFFKTTPASDFQGNLSGTAIIASTGASSVNIDLSASVSINITGELYVSEYFEMYSETEYPNFLPMDSAILNWRQNTDLLVDFANFGAPWPTTTIPNNQVKTNWYQPIPLNGATLRSSLGLTPANDMSFSGYTVAPSGARAITLDREDGSGNSNWININNGNCIMHTLRNTSAARRFADDGNRENVFLSALINVEELGGEENEIGSGDLIALSNAVTGPANNNVVKIVALLDGMGGFNFGLIKENENNPTILSEESYDFNTTYLAVISHEFVEGDNNDITKLYILSSGDSIPLDIEETTPVATIDETYSAGLDPTDLSIIFLRERIQAGPTPKARLTGIRVGNTYRATMFAEEAVNGNENIHNRILTDNLNSCQ